MMRILLLLCCGAMMSGCGIGKSSFYPRKKYSPIELQRDYSLYQTILEGHHPSLYWYTPKDSMDYYFKQGRNHLNDSLTEPEFRKVLSYVTAKVNCGHTSVRSSKKWMKYSDTARIGRLFPLSMKLWNDTMVVTGNLHRRDSILKRGTMITSINGMTGPAIIDTLFEYISTDGYNRTHKFQTLSNRGFFGSLFTSVFGLSNRYSLDYIDSAGTPGNLILPVYNPATDTARRATFRADVNIPQPSKKERKHQQFASVRLLQIDSVSHTAMMNLASFSRGFGLKAFFRRSFRQLRKNDIRHLIIDVRSNGG
ncbi:MAG TPA: peptidase S41, partial [Chitinophagaceae bacterium]|nr:peptidase S41 [Chitinophagaceae bacterium]